MRAGNNKFWKRVSRFLNKYINGTKGVISLFMVLVLSPLLSVSLLLVESARYQDAKERMQEIVDVSAFSTIADYDSYLDERFGLLSVSQNTNINSSFKEYLDTNNKALGKSVTIDSSTAEGEFPLSETDVLKQQLLEYSELSVSAEAMIEGFDLDKLLKELEESLETKEIKKEMDALEAAEELAVEVSNLVKAINDTKNKYTVYKRALSEYGLAYRDFEAKAVVLINALRMAELESIANGIYVPPYERIYVKIAVQAVRIAARVYQTKAGTLKKELKELTVCIDKTFSSLARIPAKLQNLKNKTSGSSLAAQCTTSIYDWLYMVIDQATTSMKKMVGNDYKDRANEEGNKLQKQITKLGKLEDRTIKMTWTIAKIKSEYGPVKINSIRETFGKDISKLMSDLNNKANIDSAEKAKLTNLLDVAGELFGVSVLYDSSLDSIVNKADQYAETEPSLSSKLAMDSLTNLITSCEKFVDGISSMNIIKAVTAVIPLLKAIFEFLAAVVAWVVETVVNLVDLISTGPREWYNSLLLYGYGSYNMPCRTTYEEGKTLSGYGYSKVFDLAGGKYRKSLSGALKQLKTISNQSGSDVMFKGAETEYLLIGSPSELYNQSSAFFNLYLLRLMLDMKPVLTNKEVSMIAAPAGPAAAVVKMAIVLVEPMLDSIILVNKGKSFLFKDTVYVSYSGFILLQQDLVGITSISKNIQEKIKDSIKAHNGQPKRKGKFEITYKEHMLLLLLLSTNQSTYMKRIKNLIQMEAKEKHKNDYQFNLDKTYTYIDSDVNYTLNPMFNFEALTKNGLFTARSKQYIGY